MMLIRSWWTYTREFMGYNRPSPVTPDDIRQREEAHETTERLLDGLLVLKKSVRARTPIVPNQEW